MPNRMLVRPRHAMTVVIAIFSVISTAVESFQPVLVNTAPRTTSSSTAAPLAYSSGATLEPPHGGRLPFDERMRQLIKNNSIATPSTTKPDKRTKPVNPSKPKHVHEVTTVQEFKTVVAEETDQITVVRYYAPWCRACKAVQPMFYRLGQAYPNVKFVEVPVTKDNMALHQALGVPSLPFGHVYLPNKGLAEELRISKTRFSDFKTILDSYVNQECALPEDVDPYTKVYEAPYSRN